MRKNFNLSNCSCMIHQKRKRFLARAVINAEETLATSLQSDCDFIQCHSTIYRNSGEQVLMYGCGVWCCNCVFVCCGCLLFSGVITSVLLKRPGDNFANLSPAHIKCHICVTGVNTHSFNNAVCNNGAGHLMPCPPALDTPFRRARQFYFDMG